MKIYIFPKIEHIDNMDKPIINGKIIKEFEDKHFNQFYDKVTNVWKLPILYNDTIQASNDGVWKCIKGSPIRNPNKKITIDTRTLTEIKPNSNIPKEFKQTDVDDFVEHTDFTFPEFIIISESGITQEDLDLDFSTKHLDMGCGFSSFVFNGKRCTIFVLEENKTLTEEQITKLTTECKRDL